MNDESALSSIKSLQKKLYAVLGDLSNSLESKADFIILWLYDSESDEFGLPIRYPIQPEISEAELILHPGTHIGGEVIVDKKEPVIISENIRNSVMDGEFVRRHEINSSAGFPLIHNGQVIGVLFVSYCNSHIFLEGEQKIITEAAERATSIIITANVFAELRSLIPEQNQTLKAVSDLAFRILRKPVTIWIFEPDNNTVHIRAMTGVTKGYFENASAQIDDGSTISQALKTSELIIENKSSSRDESKFREYAVNIGWPAWLVFSINIRGEPIGIIEILGRDCNDLRQIERPTLRRLAHIASAGIENYRLLNSTRQLADIAKILGNTPNTSEAMKTIVEKARELTGADFSTILLFNRTAKRYVPYVPADEVIGNLIDFIIPQDLILKADTHITEPLLKREIRSVVGVPIEMQGEQGALYVYSNKTKRFNKEHVRLLETLANIASATLSWAHRLLEIANEIEIASKRLFNLDETLDKICGQMLETLKFDDKDNLINPKKKQPLCAIQLINKEKQIIETVKAKGPAEAWGYVAKHRMDIDESTLWDIQVDVARSNPPRIELIAGWDERFDKMIYDNFGHKDLVRVWIPIVLIRDESGIINNSQMNDIKWLRNRELDRSIDDGLGKKGCRRAFQLHLLGNNQSCETIGTLEIGVAVVENTSPDKAIELFEDDMVITQAKQVSQSGLSIYQCSLQYVFEIIAENAKKIINADFSTLHFSYDYDRQRYVYEVGSSEIDRYFFENNPPRKTGLGRLAIESNKPLYIPDPAQGHNAHSLEGYNKRSYDKGTRAMLALPLLVDQKEGVADQKESILGQKEGVLYVLFKRVHWFSEDQIGWVSLYANRAMDAIRHATNYTETLDNAKRLVSLDYFAKSLATTPDKCSLLSNIAGNILNMLVADVVTVYEYIEAEGCFPSAPSVMGRLKRKGKMGLPVDKTSPPVWLVEHGEDIYATDVKKNSTLYKSYGKNYKGEINFIEREGIVSSAGILMKAVGETVGVVFINYRKSHEFTSFEIKILKMLTSIAAIAIKNQRLQEKP